MLEIDEILTKATAMDASDIHLVSGHRPTFRVHKEMTPIEDYSVLTPTEARAMLEKIATPDHLKKFDEICDADFSYAVEGVGRFRVNAHMQNKQIGLSLRSIKEDIPPLSSLNLPQVISKLTYLPRGLVLVTGETGSGKSTTLAAMIQEMNKRYRKHIITLEDPVEYTLKSEQCVIEQRELGADTPSFSSGLRHVLRQDPDIILVGEMRDLETTAAAITAAETGHLVLSTLHTNSAASTIDRIIDMYPAGQQNQIRTMLSNTLQAVICQVLFKRTDKPGMAPALEIMLSTPAVRNLIREKRTFEIQNVIETNRAMGMTTLDNSIMELFFNGMIDRRDAIAKSNNPEKIERAIAA